MPAPPTDPTEDAIDFRVRCWTKSLRKLRRERGEAAFRAALARLIDAFAAEARKDAA